MRAREVDRSAVDVDRDVDGRAAPDQHLRRRGDDRKAGHHHHADAVRSAGERLELVVPRAAGVLLHQRRDERGLVGVAPARVALHLVQRHDVGVQLRDPLRQPIRIPPAVGADTAVVRVPVEHVQR